MALVNPAPGGTEGRTDQGVDWSNIRGNIIAVAKGTIVSVYRGLSGFGNTVIERLSSGQEVYYALETGGGNPVVHVGQTVGAKQAIAPGLGSGGIEVGWWNPSTGRAEGAPGYSEGVATTAGQNFRSAISSRRVQNVPSYVPAGWVHWVQQAASETGLPAPVVAAQINDESGFSNSVTSPTGAQGAAQIEPATWKSLGISGSPYTASGALQGYTKYMKQLLSMYNGDIRKALAAYNAGPANLAAGYGYADSILSKAGQASTARAGTTTTPIVRPGGQESQDTGQDVDALFSAYEATLNTPRTAPPSISSPKDAFGWWWQSFTGNWEAEQEGSSGSSGS
jgi:Transglycosylase SLT domain